MNNVPGGQCASPGFSAQRQHGYAEVRTFEGFENAVHDAYIRGRRALALKMLREYAGNGPLKNIPYVKNRILADREILEKKTRLTSKPTSLRITLTTRCNLRCIMCPFHAVSWDIPQRAVREVVGLMPYLKNLQWYGGEAFLSRHFEPLFDLASGYPFLSQRVNTNGLLFTKKWIKKLVLNGTGIDLSIDGFDKKTYEHIRKGGDFSKLRRNLDLLAEYRDKYSSRALRHTELTVNCIVMESNFDTIEEIVGFARRYGIERIILNRLGYHIGEVGVFLKENILGYTELRSKLFKKLDRIKMSASRYGITVVDHVPREDEQAGTSFPGADGSPRPGTTMTCHVPWRQLCVNPGGTVTPHCYCLKETGMIQNGSLMTMWNGASLQNYRKHISRGAYTSACPIMCSNGSTENDLSFMHL